MYIEIDSLSEDGLTEMRYSFTVRVGGHRTVDVVRNSITKRVKATRRHKKWVMDWTYQHLWRRGSQTCFGQVFENPGVPEWVRAEVKRILEHRTTYDFG